MATIAHTAHIRCPLNGFGRLAVAALLGVSLLLAVEELGGAELLTAG